MSESSWFSDPAYTAGLDRLAALQSAAAVSYAAEARVLTELAEGATHDGWRGSAPFATVLLEVAGTCVIGQQTAAIRLADAQHLVTQLRGTLARLEAGTLGVPQAKVLSGETRHLDALICAQVEERVLLDAAELPPGRLRERIRRVVLMLDAAEAARRAARGRSNRRVWARQAEEDGMGLLLALLPAEHVAAVQLSLTEQARALSNTGDSRTVDQLRADLLTELTGRRIAPPGPPLPSASPIVVACPGAAGDAVCPAEPMDGDPTDGHPTDGDLAPAPQPGPVCDPVTGEILKHPPSPPTEAESAEPPDAPCPACGHARPAEPPDIGAGPRASIVVRPPQVVIHVPLATALGVSDAPGQLEPGGTLLPAAQAHELLPTAEIRALFVDATTGRPLAAPTQPLHRPTPTRTPRRRPERAAPAASPLPMISQPSGTDAAAHSPVAVLRPSELRDLLTQLALTAVPPPHDLPEPQHDPSAPLARFVRLRDRGCDGIGCSVPASACELDHCQAWPVGPTSAANLKPRSQRCHHAKHAGWAVSSRSDGTTTWASPSARTYRTFPRWHRPPTVPAGTRLPTPEGLAKRVGELLDGRDNDVEPLTRDVENRSS